MNDCVAELSTDLITGPKGKQVTSKNTHFSVNGVSTRLSKILSCHVMFNLLIPDDRPYSKSSRSKSLMPM